MTRKLYYIFNPDNMTRISTVICNKKVADRICRDAKKNVSHMCYVGWQWDDANGHAEIIKLHYNFKYLGPKPKYHKVR